MRYLILSLFLVSGGLYSAESVEPQTESEAPSKEKEIKRKKKKETKVVARAENPFMTKGPLHERKLDY